MPKTECPDDSLDLTQLCKHCKTENVVLKLDAKEPQCRSCFLSYVNHKFRACLGSSRILQRDSNVVLVVDGSAKSIVLLDMVRFALQVDRYRKLRFNPKVLYVDEQPLIDSSTSDRILAIIKGYTFESFYLPIGSVAAPVPITDLQLHQDAFAECRSRFIEQFHALGCLTSKQDFLVQLRKRMWRSVAKSLNCGLVFFPETNIDLAKRLLTDISLGRGSSAAHDVSFVDERMQDVKLVRPIRDLNEMEVDHYIRLNELQFEPDAGRFGEDEATGASIQNLTNEFVRSLQRNYSSTVTTVFRTGDKLAPLMNENSVQCRICLSHLDTTTGSETLFATELSGYLSTHTPDLDFKREIVPEEANNGLSDLCHSCLSICRDSSGAKDFIFAFNE